jgi:hypothetical protein
VVLAGERPRAVDDVPAPLFGADDAAGYRRRWSAIQTGFVDEPRKAVQDADTLVVETMKRLAEVFADERRQLESQWDRTDQASTEDLRLAMRRYRVVFRAPAVDLRRVRTRYECVSAAMQHVQRRVARERDHRTRIALCLSARTSTRVACRARLGRRARRLERQPLPISRYRPPLVAPGRRPSTPRAASSQTPAACGAVAIGFTPSRSV